LPQGLRNTYLGNWQPRVSFAYRPFNDTKTVLRGGLGVFTMTNLGALSLASQPPTCTPTRTAATGTHPLIQYPNTAPATVGVQYGGGSLDQGVDPNYRDPQRSPNCGERRQPYRTGGPTPRILDSRLAKRLLEAERVHADHRERA
jgi:hypothetical protein